MNKAGFDSMKDYMEKKLDEYSDRTNRCSGRIEYAQEQIEEAAERMKQATAQNRFEDYKKAVHDKEKAEMEISFYRDKLAQIKETRAMSQDESDAGIEKIFTMQDDLQADYLREIAEPVAQIIALRQQYIEAITESNEILTAWVSKIWPYYKNSTVTRADGTKAPGHVIRSREFEPAQAVNDCINRMTRLPALMENVKPLLADGIAPVMKTAQEIADERRAAQ